MSPNPVSVVRLTKKSAIPSKTILEEFPDLAFYAIAPFIRWGVVATHPGPNQMADSMVVKLWVRYPRGKEPELRVKLSLEDTPITCQNMTDLRGLKLNLDTSGLRPLRPRFLQEPDPEVIASEVDRLTTMWWHEFIPQLMVVIKHAMDSEKQAIAVDLIQRFSRGRGTGYSLESDLGI